MIRFKQWGLYKNLKELEARAVVRKQHQRLQAGKPSAFRINGREIDLQSAISHLRRKGLSINAIAIERSTATTPPSIEFWTPVPPPLRTPESLERPEVMIRSLRIYCQGTSEPRAWESIDQLKKYKSCLDCLLVSLNNAALFFQSGASRQAGQALITGLAEIENIVRFQHPSTYSLLLSRVWNNFGLRMPGIGLVVLRQFGRMARTLFSERHPLYQMCSQLALISSDQVLDTALISLEVLIDNVESVLGGLTFITVRSRVYHIRMCMSFRDRGWVMSTFQNLIQQCKSTLGSRNLLTCYVRRMLGRWLMEIHDERAVAILEECLENLSSSDWRVRTLRFDTLKDLAHCYYNAKSYSRAGECLREASDLCLDLYGLHSAQFIKLLTLKDSLLVHCGEKESAAQVREQWTRIQGSIVEIL